MLRIKRKFFSLLVLSLAAFGCNKDNEGPRVEPVDLAIQVTYDEDFVGSFASGVNITLTNVTSQQVFTGETNEMGLLDLKSIPAGQYDVLARKTFTAQEFENFSGISTDQEEVVFNASLSGVAVTTLTASMDLTLKTGRVGDLVIKQVYFSGSHRVEGAVFRDQFVEVYNNSNDTLYMDGLYIMGTLGKANTNTGDGYLANGQYDWTQSIGMVGNGNPNEDYLYGKWIYRFPGNGQDYPVFPGASVIVAQNALNHKTPFVGNDGEAISVLNPALTVDLSGADFEVYLADDGGNPLASDIDNPAVPNMDVIFAFGRDFILDNLGREAIVLFRTEQNVLGLPAYPTPNVTNIGNSTKLYFQVPTDWVIDAVEAQPSPTNQVPLKLPNDLDASYTYVPGGSYSSQSVVRRTAKLFGNRRVLMDSNSSESDFGYAEIAIPRGFID